MIDSLIYCIMQAIGYRFICFDLALARGIPINGYSGWFFYPQWSKGTYRERKSGYLFSGYGTDK